MLNDRYPATSGHALQFRMFTDPGSAHSPDTALAALKRRELVSTASVDGPTWFLVDVPSEPKLGESAIDIPSRLTQRSEERRVGKECGSTCRSRWSPDH